MSQPSCTVTKAETPRARVASRLGALQDVELVLGRKFGVDRALALRATRASSVGQAVIALRPDHEVDRRRAADDLLAFGLRDAARDRDHDACGPSRAAASLIARMRPSSE